MVAQTDREGLNPEVHVHRLWSGDGGIAELVARGKRDPAEVARVLQVIKDKPDFVSVFFPKDKGVEAQLKEWQQFYKEVWGIKQDLSKLPIPAKHDGFNWLVVMLEGMTARRIVNKMRERMKVWAYNDSWLDEVESDREPNRDYAIWLRDRIEADEELKNLSANDLKARGVNSITLPERLMLEFFYYWKTNQHLDISNWTLCAGSRSPHGCVPHVRWRSRCGRVRVYWCDAGGAYGHLRCREAVS